MVVTGFIIEHLGWPSVFYVIGVLSIFHFVAWMYFVYDTPDQHPRISVLEREYIKAAIGPSTTKVSRISQISKNIAKTEFTQNALISTLHT